MGISKASFEKFFERNFSKDTDKDILSVMMFLTVSYNSQKPSVHPQISLNASQIDFEHSRYHGLK